jgi:hypothetical protein
MPKIKNRPPERILRKDVLSNKYPIQNSIITKIITG